MLYETYDNPKLLPFKDETEEKRIDVLFNESCTIAMRSMRNRGLSYSDGERYEAIGNEIVELHDALIKRYVASFASAEQGLMDDLSELLNAITADEVNAWIAENIADYHSLTDEEEKSIRMLLDYNYTSAHLYMQTAVKAQLLAVDFCGGDTAAAEKLVAASAAAFYEPRQGEAEAIPRMLYPVRDGFAKRTEAKEFLPSLTPIVASKTFLMPTTKAAHGMVRIAEEGRKGMSLNVGTENEPVEVIATYVPPDGENLSDTDKRYLYAISDMMRNAVSYPMTVTPAQIYRAYACLDSDASVSEAAEQEAIEAVERLKKTEMTIDFQEQVNKHKRIVKKDGFDYDDPKLSGNAIDVWRASVPLYRGRERKIAIAYTFNAMPLVSYYSHLVGQEMLLPREYLSAKLLPSTPSKQAAKKVTRNSGRTIALRQEIALWIEYTRKKATKAKKTKGWNRLSYETIAKNIGIAELSVDQRKRLMLSVEDILNTYEKMTPPMIKGHDRYKDDSGNQSRQKRKKTGYIGIEVYFLEEGRSATTRPL